MGQFSSFADFSELEVEVNLTQWLRVDTPTIAIVGFSATHLSGASALVQSYGLCQAAPFLNILLVEEPLYDVLSTVQVRIVH